MRTLPHLLVLLVAAATAAAQRVSRPVRASAIVALMMCVGCGSATSSSPSGLSPQPTAPIPPAPGVVVRPLHDQFLRIVNRGPSAAGDLSVIFPDRVRVDYGTVSPGATTDHRLVPGGVFEYAAYTLEVDGRRVDQPVIDWVGEQPMEGRSFTYTIEVDASQQRPVRLVAVARDE
jgi:hypothetical protein